MRKLYIGIVTLLFCFQGLINLQHEDVSIIDSNSNYNSINVSGTHFPFAPYTLNTTLNTIIDGGDNEDYTHLVNTGEDAFHLGIGTDYDTNNSGAKNHRIQIVNITGELLFEDELDWSTSGGGSTPYGIIGCADYSVHTLSCGAIVSTFDEQNDMIYFAYLICSWAGPGTGLQNVITSMHNNNQTICSDSGIESSGSILKIAGISTITKTVNHVASISYSNCDSNSIPQYSTKLLPYIYPGTLRINVDADSLYVTFSDSVVPGSKSFGLNQPNLFCDRNHDGNLIGTLGGRYTSNHQGPTYFSAPMLQSFHFNLSNQSNILEDHSTLKSNYIDETQLVGKYALTISDTYGEIECYNLWAGSYEKAISAYSESSYRMNHQHYPGNFTIVEDHGRGADLIDSTCSIVKSWNFSFPNPEYLYTSWSNTTSIFVSGYSDSFGGPLNYTTAVPSRIFIEINETGTEIGFISEYDTYFRDYGYGGGDPLKKRSASYGTSKLNYDTSVFLLPDFDDDEHIDYYDSFPFEQSQWSDSDGDGYGDEYGGYQFDSCVNIHGDSFNDVYGCLDFDGDGYSNAGDAFINRQSQYLDSDSDGYGDNISGFQPDHCPTTSGESNRNSTYGCPDTDFDGWADLQDEFPLESSQWSDSDGDGFGDQYNGFEGDTCPSIFGNSTLNTFGCPDADKDGWSDNGDDLPHESTQWLDLDGDGFGNNQSIGALMIDWFPNDGTQWNDSDGDGHGDNPFGSAGDKFPNDPLRWSDKDNDGVADADDDFTTDSTQWSDTDGDGYGDNQFGNSPDRFPNDSTRWQDSDFDGYADEDDAFVNDATQWSDIDGDGYGDNPEGYEADEFIDDKDEWKDSDSDGLGDNTDAFPFDPTQTEDRDGDGMGDNPMGIGADKFPDDVSQWSDIDGDGYGDNQNGNSSDAFITDATQWSDMDGDGYGDNPAGRLADAFPNDSTQWEDLDGDGLGDNQTGTNADPYLNDFDNDGYNDSIDILPKFSSPGDLDADGCLDEDDQFPANSRECSDADGDGIGDNEDPDDDNDGWSDTDELRLGTDSLNSAEQPVDSFELLLPGSTIGLGAWDLIGIFGGVPIFIWLLLGFVTRNGRTAVLEERMKNAMSREELEEIALKSEYLLMMRLIGPHQGIRLERIRAELDDALTDSSISDDFSMDYTTPLVVSSKPLPSETGDKDGDGYEWITRDDSMWYRTTGSNSEWEKWTN